MDVAIFYGLRYFFAQKDTYFIKPYVLCQWNHDDLHLLSSKYILANSKSNANFRKSRNTNNISNNSKSIPKLTSTLSTNNIFGNYTKLRRKPSITDLENLSFTTFQKLNLEKKNCSRDLSNTSQKLKLDKKTNNKETFHSLHKSKSTNDYKLAAMKADRNSLYNNNKGFEHYNVPKVINRYEWASKERWENTKTGNVCKDIFRSMLLSSTNRKNLQAKEVIEKRKIKPKEDFLIESFCEEENKTLNELKKSSLKLPNLPLLKKFNPKEIKNDIKTKYMGDKYNPHNFDVVRIRKNTCSLNI